MCVCPGIIDWQLNLFITSVCVLLGRRLSAAKHRILKPFPILNTDEGRCKADAHHLMIARGSHSTLLSMVAWLAMPAK
jgi:hypothetical protein